MPRFCERPGCGDPASVCYGFDASQRMVWLEALGPSPQMAGVLCQRHADAMRLPNGWWLQDRRSDQALFPSRTDAAAPQPAADVPAVAPYRPPRARPRRRPAAAPPLPIEAPEVAGDAAAIQAPEPADHATDTTGGADDVVAPAWTPAFDAADDLGGLLDAKTPLLSRAFGRPDAKRPD